MNFKAILLGVALTLSAVSASAGMVKQSSSGICHDEGSSWYDRTKNFTAYGSMQECMATGRAYKGYSGSATVSAKTSTSTQSASSAGSTSQGFAPYDRGLYNHWIDTDRDCLNTRQELLQELSTSATSLAKSGCTVSRGRWNDPYTGNIYTSAKDLDIDHIVPLAWAHAHGAHSWSSDLREKFANDRVNLLAVQASANRQKGAKGPLEWLPSNKAYQCQYVTRFHRIVLTYKLQYSDYEAREMESLRKRLCGA
jgi:hypothetical protein